MSNVSVAPAKNPAKHANLKRDVFGRDPKTMTAGEIRDTISGYELKHQIEALVRAITAKKIKHIYRGDGAATAPGMMILPLIPATFQFTKREVRIILGYAAHEISHQLETEFDTIGKCFADINKPTKRELQVKEFWNAIEDYRIERITRLAYPGFPVLINATREHSARMFVDRVGAGMLNEKALSNPYQMASVALTWVGAKLNKYPTPSPEAALNCLDPELKAWCEGWAADMEAVQTCDDAFVLAGRILDELDQLREEEPENPEPNPDNSKGGENDKGDGTAESKSNPSNGQGNQTGKGDQSPPSDPKDDDGSTSAASPDNYDNSANNEGKEPEEQDASEPESQEEKNEADKGEDAPEPADGKADDGSDGKADTKADDNGNDDSTDQTGDDQPDGKDTSADNSAGDREDDPSNENGSSQDQSRADDPSQGDDDGDGDPSSGEGGPDGNDTAAGGAPASGASSAGGKNDSSDDESAKQKSRPKLKVEDGDEQADPEAADLDIDDVIEAMGKKAKGKTLAESPDVKAPDDIGMPSSSDGEDDIEIERTEVQRMGSGEYTRLKRDIGPSAARSAGIVRRMLQSQNRTKTRGGMEDGDLDFRRLIPMALGAADVYQETRITRQINTALSLLVDNSGSMSGLPLEVCQKSAIVIDMAVQGTPTALEITGFTSDYSGATIIYQYRRFGQKSTLASASLGNMKTVALGGTPVATPVLEALRRLRERPEPKRIMIVISDGQADDPEDAAAARELAEKQGCIVVGIAIGHAVHLQKWCERVVAIQDINELPAALTEIVRSYLKA